MSCYLVEVDIREQGRKTSVTKSATLSPNPGPSTAASGQTILRDQRREIVGCGNRGGDASIYIHAILYLNKYSSTRTLLAIESSY